MVELVIPNTTPTTATIVMIFFMAFFFIILIRGGRLQKICQRRKGSKIEPKLKTQFVQIAQAPHQVYRKLQELQKRRYVLPLVDYVRSRNEGSE